MSAPVQLGPSPSGGGPAPSLDVDEYVADIGDRIRAEREGRGWSQTRLGQRAGISLNTVKRLEHGVLSVRTLIQACLALEVRPDVLLSDQWRMPDPLPVRRSSPSGRMDLSPQQVLILREAASGDSLTKIGARLGIDSSAVGGVLSRVYQRLGVAFVPAQERRAAAVRVACAHGLLDPQSGTS